MKKTKKKRKKSSAHSDQDNYLRPELWANGTLVYWNTPNHRQEKYQAFHKEMILRATRLGKI